MSDGLKRINWVKGDFNKIDFPADSSGLDVGGVEFLTQAFQLMGSLNADNRVLSITEMDEVNAGSTGRKLRLSVVYEHNSHCLHNDLFVKFSRDLSDPTRDAAKRQMELEVKFAFLTRDPTFPLHVPTCYFADFHHESGTGILITQSIPYGVLGVEKHYAKALDYKMPDPLGHYRALLKSLARIAGFHKAGLLSAKVAEYFPFDPRKLDVGLRKPLTLEQVSSNVLNLKLFASHHPNLLPEHLRSEAFFKRLAKEASEFYLQLEKVAALLQSQPALIALCHWNAHVDNAWFWRDEYNQLDCGLMDWGNVSQMNVAMAIWGCLSAAELAIWNDHLDELLSLFVSEFKRYGGDTVSVKELRQHLLIYVAKMGLTWLMDIPLRTLQQIPRLADIKSRHDLRIEGNEAARSQLTILIAFLNLWQQSDMAEVISYMQTFTVVSPGLA